LDARRCISYLTIEHHGLVDVALRAGLGNRIYGCDDCLAVCPWNKFAERAAEVKYHGRPELIGAKLADLALLDDAAFRMLFSGSPVKRIGHKRFVRNVCYAIGNSGDQSLIPVVQSLIEDVDIAVADAARWAFEKLHVAQ
jgi:epoxyqueuosine reductase